MSDFFKSKKFKALILIVALLFGMMLYTASQEGVSGFPQNLLEVITTPVQKVTAAISNSVGSFFDQFVNSKNNADENKILKEQNAELVEKLIELERLRQENEQLREVAGIKTQNEDFETAVASVVSRDPGDRYGSFIIDKGTLHGISINDPVMTRSGLVGIVSSVGPTSARVKTILSPEIDVSAIEIVSKELGVIQGDIALAQEGQTRLSILSAETNLKEGDLLVTAGASGTYPKNIPIGRVAEVLTEAHGVTKYATIVPLVSVDEVESVVVITDFLGQGSELIDFDE